MAGPSNEGTERKTDRLEAFSDAVLAIAITLPVVDLQRPDLAGSPDLAAAYARLAPDYGAYGLSALVIGLYWAHSHFSGKIVEKTDHGFNLLSVLFLALVSVTPFPARPFMENLSDPVNARTAASVYACVLSAPSLAWLVRWFYARRQGLLDPRLEESYLHKLTLRYTMTALVFVLGAATTILGDWRIGIGVIALMSLSYLFPPITPRFKRGQEPENELQEADERPR